MSKTTILIIEDGNEYLENLRRFVVGPTYLQAHDAGEALAALAAGGIDLVYLDMRFDRIAHERLVGDHEETIRECNGDSAKAWRFLQDNQGLFILDAIAARGAGGLGTVPVILAYDFSRERKRWDRLRARYPNLAWVGDAVTAEEIERLMRDLLAP